MKNLKLIKLIYKIKRPLWMLYDDNNSSDLATYSDEVGRSEYKVRYGEDLIRIIDLMKKIERLFLFRSINKKFLGKLEFSDIEFYESFSILYGHLVFESREKLAQFLNLFFELDLNLKNGKVNTHFLIKKLQKNSKIKSFGLDKNFNLYENESETAKKKIIRSKDFHDFYYSGYDPDLMMAKIFERKEIIASLSNEILTMIKREFPHNKKWKEKRYQEMKKTNQEIIKNLNDVTKKLEMAIKLGKVKINDFGFNL